MPEKIEGMSPELSMLTGFLQSLTVKQKEMQTMELQKQKDQALAWRTMMPVIEQERGKTVRHMAEQTAKLEQFMAGITSKEKIAGQEYELGLKDLDLKIKALELKAITAGKELDFKQWQTEYNADVQKALKGLELKLEEFKASAGLMETMEEIAGRKAVSKAQIAGRKEVSAGEIAGRKAVAGMEIGSAEAMATEAKASREQVAQWQITASRDLAELAKAGKLTDIERSEVDTFDNEIERVMKLQVSLSAEPDNIMLATSLMIELDRLEARRTGVINPLRATAGMSEIPALPLVVPGKERMWPRRDIPPAIQARPALTPAPAPAPAAEPEQPATFNKYLADAVTPLKAEDRTFLLKEGWSREMIIKLDEAIEARLGKE